MGSKNAAVSLPASYPKTSIPSTWLGQTEQFSLSLAARFLYLLCGLGVVYWESFLGARLRTGWVLSRKTAQKYQWRLERGWGSAGSARLLAMPLSLPISHSPVSRQFWGGAALHGKRWMAAPLQCHQSWADALHHPRGSSAHYCSTHRSTQGCQSQYDYVPEAARQMNFLDGIHLYF